jgi:hypothetical protein
MGYIQASIVDRTVYLSLVNVPATGVPYTAITVAIKKQGQSSFTTKTLVSADWVELGNGLYSIVFSAIDTDTVGDFTFTIAGAAFDNQVFNEFTIEPAPAPGSPVPLPQQCIVSGNVANISALPPSREPLKIVAYLPSFPAKYNGTILIGDSPYTFADAYGNFSLALVRNSTVIIEIKRAGIRAQITIPDAPTANITDLLPPFATDYSL